MVIVMNKWDLVDDDRRNQLDREIDRHLDQVEWAQRVLAAMEASNGSAVQLDGKMVDLPVVLQAQRLLARVR